MGRGSFQLRCGGHVEGLLWACDLQVSNRVEVARGPQTQSGLQELSYLPQRQGYEEAFSVFGEAIRPDLCQVQVEVGGDALRGVLGAVERDVAEALRGADRQADFPQGRRRRGNPVVLDAATVGDACSVRPL